MRTPFSPVKQIYLQRSRCLRIRHYSHLLNMLQLNPLYDHAKRDGSHETALLSQHLEFFPHFSVWNSLYIYPELAVILSLVSPASIVARCIIC